jgi:hypothetical protein
MAVQIETGLLSKLNRYDEVDPDTIAKNRLGINQLPEDAFRTRNTFSPEIMGAVFI